MDKSRVQRISGSWALRDRRLSAGNIAIMEARSIILAAGLILNSALYLIGVMIASIVLHKPNAMVCDVVACGIAYLSYFIQLAGANPRVGTISVGCSVIAGTAAGVMLLV